MEAYEADELASYRSLSSLAIVAFVLGLISPLALLSPLFIVIPLAGIAVSLLAIYKIRSQAVVLTGIPLAKIALFLSVFCLIVAPTKAMVRSQLYQHQADEAARKWLITLADGNLSESLKHITPDAMRGLTPPDLSAGPPSSRTPRRPSDEDAVEVLGKDPLVAKLRSQSQDGPLPIKTRVAVVDDSRTQPTVNLNYHFDSGDDSFSFEVLCVRFGRPNLGDSWQVGGWKLIN